MSGQDNPVFIVLEGLDGVGTTSHCASLVASLRGIGRRVVPTREPSGGVFGMAISSWLSSGSELSAEALTLGFCADRSDHVGSVIGPALMDGFDVVCDRYVLSTLAYQGSAGVDVEWILSCSSGLLTPDLTVVLDCDRPTRRARLAARTDVDRFEDPALDDALEDGYRLGVTALRSRGHELVSVDSSRDFSAVSDEVFTLVTKWLQ